MALLDVRETDGVIHVRWPQRGDVAVAREMRDELLAQLRPGAPVLIDLEEVDRLDGAGLQLVLAAQAWVERNEGRCSLRANEKVRRQLQTVAAAAHLKWASPR